MITLTRISLLFMLLLTSSRIYMQDDTVILDLEWNPDGTSLTVAGRNIPPLSAENFIEVIQPFDGVYNNIMSLRWNNDGDRIAARIEGNMLEGTRIYIWDSNNRSTAVFTPSFPGASDYNLLTWSPDSQFVAADQGGTIYVYETTGGTPVSTLLDQTITGVASVIGIAWSADSQNIYALYDIGSASHLLVWDIQTESIMKLFLGARSFSGGAYPTSLDISPDGKWLAVAVVVNGDQTSSSSILILDSNTGNEYMSMTVPRSIPEDIRVPKLIWHSDNSYLIGVTYDGVMFVWDVFSQKLIHTIDILIDSQFYMRDVALSPYGGRLAILTRRYGANSQEARSTLDRQNILQQSVLVLVPFATAERFAEIAAFCGAPASLTTVAEDASLQAQSVESQGPALLAQLDALPEDAIPPGCEADLRAIAAAMASP